jgi:hypothetical protein
MYQQGRNRMKIIDNLRTIPDFSERHLNIFAGNNILTRTLVAGLVFAASGVMFGLAQSRLNDDITQAETYIGKQVPPCRDLLSSETFHAMPTPEKIHTLRTTAACGTGYTSEDIFDVFTAYDNAVNQSQEEMLTLAGIAGLSGFGFTVLTAPQPAEPDEIYDEESDYEDEQTPPQQSGEAEYQDGLDQTSQLQSNAADTPYKGASENTGMLCVDTSTEPVVTGKIIELFVPQPRYSNGFHVSSSLSSGAKRMM